MRSVALRSLVDERGKAIASLVGVACASALLLVEIGLYVGLAESSSVLVRRFDGDLWIAARGTEVLDNGRPLPSGLANRVRGINCVDRVREVVLATLPIEKKSGALDYVQVVGSEPPLVSVHGDAVAVDTADREKLQISDGTGDLSIAGQIRHVRALTNGLRSFALLPYVFSDLESARSLVGGATHYLVVSQKRACAADVRAAVGDAADVHEAASFAKLTERYWMEGSGAGATLLASAIFSAIVGAVVVGQTLYSITRDHLRELATLAAMGARTSELVSFVAWQTTLLAAVGAALGIALAAVLRLVLVRAGVAMALGPEVIAIGVGVVLSMCVLAAAPSVLRVRRVSAAEVLQ